MRTSWRTLVAENPCCFVPGERRHGPVAGLVGYLSPKAQDKCMVRIERLQGLGHELRRPEADLLRDGIYELRAGLGGINYRILYFFPGRHTAVLCDGLTKERIVPARDINLAISRKRTFEKD